MVRHVVLFRWKPEATAEEVSRVEAALGELPGKIPAIKAYRFGRDLGLRNGNADFAIIADFADQEGIATYATDPEHVAVIEKVIAPLMARRDTIQSVC